MEVTIGAFINFGTVCQNLQRQAYGYLTGLQDSAPRPAVLWAAGPLWGWQVRGGIAKLATATSAGASDSQGDHLPHSCTSTSSAAISSPFSSLSICSSHSHDAVIIGSGGNTTAAVDFGRCSCCSHTVRDVQHQQHRAARHQQQQQAWQQDSLNQLRDLSGTWIKDRERSESMDDAMNLMRLNGIVRQAVKLVKGVHIKVEPDNFTFTVFSFVSWFKVKEVYPINGEERHFRRRDLRRGGAFGRVEPHGRDVWLHLRWNEPVGGQGRDHFRLVTEDELHIESVIEVAGQTTRYMTVYNRKPEHRRQHPQDGRNPHLPLTEVADGGAGSDRGSYYPGDGGGK